METLRFVVDIPSQYLEDLARQQGAAEEQLEGISSDSMADCLRDVIIEGLEEYLGDEVSVNVRPVRKA